MEPEAEVSETLIGVKGKPVKCRRRPLIQPREEELTEDLLPLGTPPKRPKLIFTTGERVMIINIFKYAQRTKPDNVFVSNHDLVKKTSEISGVGERSIYRILREYVDFGTITEPSGRRNRPNLVQKLTEEEKLAIKGIVHSIRSRGEKPSLRKILKAVNDDKDLPSLSMTSLRRILKHLNFFYMKGELKMDDGIKDEEEEGVEAGNTTENCSQEIKVEPLECVTDEDTADTDETFKQEVSDSSSDSEDSSQEQEGI